MRSRGIYALPLMLSIYSVQSSFLTALLRIRRMDDDMQKHFAFCILHLAL